MAGISEINEDWYDYPPIKWSKNELMEIDFKIVADLNFSDENMNVIYEDRKENNQDLKDIYFDDSISTNYQKNSKEYQSFDESNTSDFFINY